MLGGVSEWSIETVLKSVFGLIVMWFYAQIRTNVPIAQFRPERDVLTCGGMSHLFR